MGCSFIYDLAKHALEHFCFLWIYIMYFFTFSFNSNFLAAWVCIFYNCPSFFRALKTIIPREEEERLNVWVAYFNLENEYGSPREVKLSNAIFWVPTCSTWILIYLLMYTRKPSRRYSKEPCNTAITKSCTWLFLRCTRGLSSSNLQMNFLIEWPKDSKFPARLVCLFPF